MNQKIFKQIRNEWRSNMWLALELLVVSVVLWFVVDYLYVGYTVAAKPLGFDVEHCYLLNVEDLTEKSPDYVNKSEEEIFADYQELYERISRRPEVEAVSISINSHPYNGSNSGGDIIIDTLRTSGYSVFRQSTPDFTRVFRYTGMNGETPEQLADILRHDKALISQNLLSEFGITDPRGTIGKKLYLYGDTVNGIEIGGVIKTVRYNDHMQGMNRSILIPGQYWSGDWTIRVRENMDRDIIETLMADADKQLRVGNLFISQVKSFSDVRDNILRDGNNDIRNYIIVMCFLLINIFLGLLGTFWFRTQQRVPDIAVRLVNGATKRDIFALLTGEGLLLLTLVTPIALAIDLNLAHLELNSFLIPEGYFSWSRILACGGIAYALMALMIVLGIALPARRAMRIAPAEALRDE